MRYIPKIKNERSDEKRKTISTLHCTIPNASVVQQTAHIEIRLM